MHARYDRWKTVAAALGLALAVLSPSRPAAAWRGDLEAEPLHGRRQGEGLLARAAAGVEIPADDAARCGKCHSACENGRVHAGRAAAPPAGLDLPTGVDGRTSCTTCHELHTSGEPARGGLLRIPNLRRELCLVCHREDADDEPRIRIVSPPERAIVHEERVALIGKSRGLSGADLTLRLNGAPFRLPAAGEEFSTWLSLQEGLNSVEIAQEERVLWRGEVFRSEGAFSGYGRETSAHRTGSREQCRDCHGDRPGTLAGGPGDRAGLCYGCHDRFEGKRYLHGPLAVGACLTCHDPHRGYGAAHLRAEQPVLCGSCHGTREIAAAACAGRERTCSDCHDPHQSNARYLLKGRKYTMGADQPRSH